MARYRRRPQDYTRGLPDRHDPTAGIGGAPSALSALTLRLWLAGFGLVLCAGGAILATRADLPVLSAVLAVAAAIAVVDLAWVAHRKRRGEPG